MEEIGLKVTKTSAEEEEEIDDPQVPADVEELQHTDDGYEAEEKDIVEIKPPYKVMYTLSQDMDSSVQTTDVKEVVEIVEVEKISSEVYCFCGVDKSDDDFVACENKEDCQSYRKRKYSLGVDGGDWFHLQCVGLKELPKSRELWICKRCKMTPNALLREDLAEENRKIVPIEGDGNCMFSSMAAALNDLDITGITEDHESVRKTMFSRFRSLVNKYKGRWCIKYRPSDEEAKENMEIYFVRKVIDQSFVISEELKKSVNTEDEELFVQQIQEYIKLKEHPAEGYTFEENLEKYGTGIEMDLFCLVYQLNIWTLNPQQKGRKSAEFRWVLSNTCKMHFSFEEQKLRPHITLLYENLGRSTDTAHYSAIVRCDKLKLSPNPSLCSYNYT